MCFARQRFGARWSVWTVLVTLAVILVVALGTCAVLAKAGDLGPQDQAMRRRLIGVALMLPCILAVTVLFAPLGYAVTPSRVVVNRLGPNVIIDRRQIAKVDEIRLRDVGLVLRTFGSGGFFGFFGRFYSRPLGRFKAYATNGRDLVLVELQDGTKFLLSPHPADAFVQILRSDRPGPDGAAAV